MSQVRALLPRMRALVFEFGGALYMLIVLFWGADIVVRLGVNWGALVWLFLSGLIAVAFLVPILIPIVLFLEWLTTRLRVTKRGEYLIFAVVFAAIGFVIGLFAAPQMISVVATTLCGLAAGPLAVWREWTPAASSPAAPSAS